MNSVTQTKSAGWSPVPHGIINAAIPDTLKLLLWYCYDKSEGWTFSVPEVARSLGKSPQCIRKYFRQFTDAKVLTKVRNLETKYGLTPLYCFHRDRVDGFVKRRLRVNPETDPETDRETDPETNPETDVETNPEINPETGDSDTKNNIPRPLTEKDCTEKEITKTNSIKAIHGAASPSSLQSDSCHVKPNLADEFEKFFQTAGGHNSVVDSTPVMPESASGPAEGGVEVPTSSTPGASPVPSIQSAYGNSNGGNKDKSVADVEHTGAASIQASANGSANTAAQQVNEGQQEVSANRAPGKVARPGKVRALMPSDAEWCAERFIRLWKKGSFTPESVLRMETEFRKRLAQNDWSTCSSSYLAMSDVKRLKEQVQKEFGDYQ